MNDKVIPIVASERGGEVCGILVRLIIDECIMIVCLLDPRRWQKPAPKARNSITEGSMLARC